MRDCESVMKEVLGRLSTSPTKFTGSDSGIGLDSGVYQLKLNLTFRYENSKIDKDVRINNISLEDGQKSGVRKLIKEWLRT